MRGALKLGPLHLHWSLLLGALLFCAPRFSPLLLLAFAGVTCAHLLGHLAAMLLCGVRPKSLSLHGLGGEFEGAAEPLQSSIIAWGGAVGQAVLVIAGLLLPLPHDLGIALVRLNGVSLALNLLPVPPLDGAEAWRIFSRLRRRARRPAMPDPRRVQRDVQDLLKKLKKPVQ